MLENIANSKIRHITANNILQSISPLGETNHPKQNVDIPKTQLPKISQHYPLMQLNPAPDHQCLRRCRDLWGCSDVTTTKYHNMRVQADL